MAIATPQLFNSTPFAVIAELLYRRTGLLVTADQVSTALTPLPGVESVTDGFLAYVDASFTSTLIPQLNNVFLSSGLTVSALRLTALDGTVTTVDPSLYSVGANGTSIVLNGALTASTAPMRLTGDFQGVPVPYVTLTANPTMPDLSHGPFVGQIRLELDRVDIRTQIAAVLVYSDAFPPTCDDFITYMQVHYGYLVEDGEFFVVGDSNQTPVARGGGQMVATLDDNRQFYLEVTNTSTRWSPGSRLLFQQQSLQSIVPPGLFAFVGEPIDGALGEPYNYTFQTVNGTAPVTYLVISGTPPCPVDPATGAMHADVLNTLAAYSWVVEAQDAIGQITTLNCIMRVSVTMLTMYPDTTTPTWTVGLPQSLNFNPYGGQRPITYAVTSGALPVGLSIVGDGLQGTMEGNPSPSNTALQSVFSITATDNQNQKVVMNFNATLNDRSEGAITASLRSKVLSWWDSSHSTFGATLPSGSILYDGTDRMNLTVGGSDLSIVSTGRSSAAPALVFNQAAYAQALTTAFNLTNNFTMVSLLNYPSSAAVVQGQVIFGRDGDSKGGYSVNVGNGDNTIALNLDVNGTPVTTNFTSTLPQGVGNWTMSMIERYNGAPSVTFNGGSMETAAPNAGPLTANNTSFFTLGASPELTAGTFFGGGAAMMAIFNDKLWSDERKWLWNTGNGRLFWQMGYWPQLTIAIPDPSLTWSIDNPTSLSLAVAGGTGKYWGGSVVAGNPLPPGMAISFDNGTQSLVISGSPTQLGTYTLLVQINSTDGQHCVNSFPVTVANAVTPLVNLPMTGTNGATTVTDSTGRIWTVNGSAAISTAVDANGAMQFPSDGTGWLSTPMTHDMDLVNMSFTAQIDVYPAVGANGGIVNSKLGAVASVPLFLNSLWNGTILQASMGWSDVNGISISELTPVGVSLAQNAWNSIKCIYDAALYKLTFFLNEQAIASGTFNGKVHSVINTSDSIILGGSSYTSQVNNPFQGYLRNFKWWSGLVYDTLALKTTGFGTFISNQSGSFTTAILGGNGVYTVNASGLPAGLTATLVNGNAVSVAGTTSVSNGIYNATITLTSGDGQNATVPITVVVGFSTLTVTPNTLPNGTVGQSYSQSVVLSGGDGNYSVAFLSGTSLPDGLTGVLSGNTYTVSGTPTTASNATVSIQFSSGDGQTATIAQSFTVAGSLDYATFLPNSTGNGMTIDSTGLLATASTTYYAYPSARLTTTPMTGKVYFEAALLESDPTYGGAYIGVADATAPLIGSHAYPASSAESVGFYPGDASDNEGGVNFWLNGTYTVYPNTTTTDALQIGVAVDVVARMAWFRVIGQGWIGGGDPATGVGGAPIGGTSDIYAMASFIQYGPNQSVTLCNAPATFQGSAPAGFTPGLVIS